MIAKYGVVASQRSNLHLLTMRICTSGVLVLINFPMPTDCAQLLDSEPILLIVSLEYLNLQACGLQFTRQEWRMTCQTSRTYCCLQWSLRIQGTALAALPRHTG